MVGDLLQGEISLIPLNGTLHVQSFYQNAQIRTGFHSIECYVIDDIDSYQHENITRQSDNWLIQKDISTTDNSVLEYSSNISDDKTTRKGIANTHPWAVVIMNMHGAIGVTCKSSDN